MQLFKKPTDEAVDRAVALISSPDQARGFFAKLENPLWVAPLAKRHVFDAPPAPKPLNGGLRASVWPQSQYLDRMASQLPGDVAAVMTRFKTENWIVVHDIVKAALAMPAASAACLQPAIASLISSLRLWHLLDEVGELVGRLASGGKTDVAIKLLDELFGVRQITGLLGSTAGQDESYLRGLTRAVSALLPIAPVESLKKLIHWQLQATMSKDKHRPSDDNYSYLWRPAIEDHEQNKDFDLAARMVPIVRDAFQKAIRDDLITLDVALGVLAERKSQLLSRVHVHLIAEFADKDVELARRTMLDQRRFVDYAAKHEYSRLMKMRFSLLTPDEQAAWLGWIDAGPEAIQPDSLDSAPDEQARRERREYWQFSHLHWIRHHLSGKWLDIYRRMHETHGDPELSEFNIFVGDVKWEGEDALSIDNLKTKGFAEVLGRLAAWNPDAQTRHLTRDDPERAFRQYLDVNVEDHSSHALEMRGKPWPLIGAFLNVMGSAAKDGKAIDIRAALQLCDWVLDNWRNQEQADDGSPAEDAHPEWSRDAIVRMIQSVCASRKDGTPTYSIEFRDTIKTMLPRVLDCGHKPYVQLPEPNDDIRLFDWPMVMVNSPKGNAMIALFGYADWVIDHQGINRSMQRSMPGGFESMPEVKNLLESELANQNQSFVSRASFGWRLGLLHWIDAVWLRERVAGIFNLPELERDRNKAYGWAAWNCFLFNSQPHVEFYNLLKDQFSYAVNQAANLPKAQDNRREPFARLAEHVILLYGRGNLGESLAIAWATDGGILRRLITGSHPSVSSHAMQFVGMSLGDDATGLPKEIVQRFMDLWERYWSEVGRKHANPTRTDSTFGYWFRCPAFPAKWLIEQLDQLVQIAPKADPDHFILDRLAKDCGVDPARSARIIRLMALGDDEGWRVHSWLKEGRKVLEVAMKAGGEAEKEARHTIDALGRLGYLDFGSLLPEFAATNSTPR